MISLEKSLAVREPDNIAKHGDLVEAFRGIAEIEEKIGKLGQVTYHYLSPGDTSGNHFHKKKFEIFFVIDGEITVYLLNPETGERFSERIIVGKKFDLVPLVAHALYNSGDIKCILGEHTNLTFNPDNPRNDVYDCEVFRPAQAYQMAK